MAPRDKYISPPVWGGNYYTARCSSPTRDVYKRRSSDRAWKSVRSVGHLRTLAWKTSSEQSNADGHYLCCKSIHSATYSVGMLIPRALSSVKAVYENNGRLLPSTTVLGVIPNAIFGISEPPTATVPEIRRSFTVPMYYIMIETYSGDGFLWIPYVEEEIATLIPSWFDCTQPIPNPSVNITEVHRMDKKGSSWDDLNWAQKHEPYIFLWNDRHSRRPLLYVLEGEFSSSCEYAQWYMAHGKPFLFQGRYMLIQKDAQLESSRWQPRDAQQLWNRVPPFGNTEINFASNPDP
ncbi:hypothetical protein CXB51_031847 [Gossypium anomalum]|uniref:Aminotransferase-like plant mobile domain-containing protein n=1 Tax=Gossypium anomalum TaxID=47600 RepID=A0A8J5Y2E1_9ROSI|nr:hypothetical protein CXB51_031847 [Gossypium anomalum]